MDFLVLIVIIIITGSAIFCGIEAALFSISLSRAKALLEQKKRGAASLVAIKSNISRPITVVVILGNIFSIAGSIVVGVVADNVLNSAAIGVASAVITFLMTTVGEIVPKSIGQHYAASISLTVAPLILWFTKLFFPIVWAIEFLTKPFIRVQKVVSEEEIRILSQLGHLEGSIEEDEKEMIQKVFLLNDLRAKDIMTPRVAMEALRDDRTLEEVTDKIHSSIHSRLPVYARNYDKIIGIAHQRELLRALCTGEREKLIREFAREVVFVTEDMRADKLIPLFQKQKVHLAIVQDEFGGTSGIVTLEDVLEQLVGEIVDEKDKYEDLRLKARERLLKQ